MSIGQGFLLSYFDLSRGPTNCSEMETDFLPTMNPHPGVLRGDTTVLPPLPATEGPTQNPELGLQVDVHIVATGMGGVGQLALIVGFQATVLRMEGIYDARLGDGDFPARSRSWASHIVHPLLGNAAAQRRAAMAAAGAHRSGGSGSSGSPN